MGIKTVMLKRKLEKSASPMELFVAQNLYTVMEELVRSEHSDNSAKLRAELTEFTNEFYSRFKQMATQVSQLVKEDTANTKTEAVQAIASMMVELRSFKADCLATIESKQREALKETEARVAKVFNNINTFKGPQGIAGRPGVNGKNGSPDTPDEVVAKVNKAENKIKISAIDGLPEELRKARKESGGGKAGGGMGQPQHETKAVSSGTTSVSLTYNVAAGGRAIWMNYQGQFLVYGTHYTVSGKTVTLTFDKVDSTFIDITYIRA